MVRLLTLLFLLQKVAYVRTSSTTIESLGPLKLRLIRLCIRKLSLIIRVSEVLWRTVWGDIDWRFDKPSGTKSSSERGASVDGIYFSGCWPGWSANSAEMLLLVFQLLMSMRGYQEFSFLAFSSAFKNYLQFTFGLSCCFRFLFHRFGWDFVLVHNLRKQYITKKNKLWKNQLKQEGSRLSSFRFTACTSPFAADILAQRYGATEFLSWLLAWLFENWILRKVSMHALSRLKRLWQH